MKDILVHCYIKHTFQGDTKCQTHFYVTARQSILTLSGYPLDHHVLCLNCPKANLSVPRNVACNNKECMTHVCIVGQILCSFGE